LRPLYYYTLLVILSLVGLGASIYGLEAFLAQNPEACRTAKELVGQYGYLGIFGATIIAGTVIPFASPALVTFAASFALDPVLLIVVATVGNTIGVLINYYLARLLGMKYLEKRMSASTFSTFEGWWSQWGVLLLVVFGVVPLLPFDLLSLLCGLFKMRLHWFLLISFSTRVVQFGIFVLLGSLLVTGSCV